MLTQSIIINLVSCHQLYFSLLHLLNYHRGFESKQRRNHVFPITSKKPARVLVFFLCVAVNICQLWSATFKAKRNEMKYSDKLMHI